MTTESSRFSYHSPRFVSVILEPERIYTDYGVIDLHREVMVCKCSAFKDADAIAKCLNLQFREQEAKQLEEPKES